VHANERSFVKNTNKNTNSNKESATLIQQCWA